MTMPKAEFDDVLQVRGGMVNLSGPVTHDGSAEARATAGTMHIHWLVAQGQTVSEGLDELPLGGGKWKAQELEPHGWAPGPAQAMGVILSVKPGASGGGAVVETFTWSQQVTLEMPG
ncbi:MAG TPA: hypothetical protein VH418_09540 [Solirubrobacteraceae bacterium]|jgi:hypothetical protein